MSIVRFRGKAGTVYWPTCDGCGNQLGPELSWEDARFALRFAHWTVRNAKGQWEHRCPECRKAGDDSGMG